MSSNMFTHAAPTVVVKDIHRAAGAATQISVLRVQFRASGTYEEQFTRPYMTIGTDDIAGQFEQILQTKGYQSSAALAGSGFQPFLISPQPEASVGIIHGWGQRRFSFDIYVAVKEPMGERYEKISGYTGYNNISSTGAIDRALELYVNRVQVHKRYGAHGHGQTSDLTVVADPTFGLDQHQQSRLVISPYAVAAHSSGVLGNSAPGMQVYDTRIHLRGEADPVSRNVVSPHGLSFHLIDNIIRSLDDMENDDGHIYVPRNNFQDSVVLRYLANSAGTPLHLPTFSWSDVLRMDPGAEHDAVCHIFHDELIGADVPQVGNVCPWGSTDFTTHSAQSCLYMLSGLMSELRIDTCAFEATNMSGEPVVYFSNIHSDRLGPDNSQVMLAAYSRRIITDVLAPVFMNGAVMYHMNYRIVPYSHAEITLSVDGGPAMPFTQPLFCDGLLGPNITSDRNALSRVSNAFDTMRAVAKHHTNQGSYGESQYFLASA